MLQPESRHGNSRNIALVNARLSPNAFRFESRVLEAAVARSITFIVLQLQAPRPTECFPISRSCTRRKVHRHRRTIRLLRILW